jgi:transcriptional regulator with XRE-family HTH domain
VSEIKNCLGKRIADLRRDRGFSQETLAEKTGYSTEFISLVERGINAPSVEGLDRIASALEVEIKELFNFNRQAK